MIRLLAFLAGFFGHVQTGQGSVFGPSSWDAKGNPHDGLACYHDRPVKDTDNLVAHPTLPCRSRVWLYNPRTKQSTVARVGDRGPRRALVDMTRRVANRLGLNGLEVVVLVPL